MLLLLPLLACSSPDPASTPPLACNGQAEHCERRLDELALPGTHNSMSSAADGWLIPNQPYGLTRQLQDGVRAMMLDTWLYEGEPMLCHSYCELGSQPLHEGLGEVQDFLDASPGEVLILIFEDHIEPELSVQVLSEVGLDQRAILPPAPGEAWPTLGELVEADRRVLMVAESGGGAAEWYGAAWTELFDTPYSFESVEDFSCELNRGAPENSLFLVNHWVSDPLSTEDNAVEANAAAVLEARVRDCEQQWDRRVNVLAVDHYAVGDLFSVVEGVNQGGG